MNYSALPNILFMTHAGSPGGAEFAMLSLCKDSRLSAKVLTFDEGTLGDLLNQHHILYHICHMPETISNIRRDGRFFATLRAIPGIAGLVKKVISHSNEADVLVPVSQKAFIAASLAKPFSRKPIIWYMNDLLSPEHFSPAMIWVITRLSRYSANHVVLNSKASLEAWLAHGGRRERISVAYSDINIDSFDEALAETQLTQDYRAEFSPNGEPLVGIFGRISQWKGQDIFLKALTKLENARGVIVGDALFGEEAYTDELTALATSLGVEDRVIFAGHSDHVPNVMAACDVITHCSTAPEPFGRVIVEGMLSGRPVIASNAGGAKEIIEHDTSGQLTTIGDADALASAITRYLNDPEWADTIAKAGRKRAQTHFSDKHFTDIFVDIVTQLKQ